MTNAHDQMTGPDNRIVVGFDGSPAAWEALRWAADEAARRQANLEIVTCMDGPSASTGDKALSEASTVGSARQRVEEAARVARCRGWHVPVSAFLASGSPGRALVDHSRGAAMLILGRQDPGSAMPAGPKSLSSFCLSNADCPVTVVSSTTRPGHFEADPRQLDHAFH